MKSALLYLVMVVLSIGLFAPPAECQCLTFGRVGTTSGNGVTGFVRAIAARREVTGEVIYVGGNFTSAGNVQARGIAKWNGSAWSAIGTPSQFNGEVRAIAFFNDELYIGGQFVISIPSGQSLRGLAKWNGNAWVAVGGQANASAVNALQVYNGSLYVGGNLLGITFPSGLVLQTMVRWDGLAWNALASTTDISIYGQVYSMVIHDDGAGPALYIGGNYGISGAGLHIFSIAKFDAGTFSELTTGVQSAVYALASFADSAGPALYVAGNISGAGGIQVSNIAKWQNGAWSALGLGITGNGVWALMPYAGKLLVGGQFTRAGTLLARSLAAWDGADWAPVGTGADPIVYAINALDDGTGEHLFIGGQFTHVNDATVMNLARSLPTAPTVFPTARILQPADVAVFTATPAGVGPFSYRWQYNGVPLVEGGRYFGTATPTLLVGPLGTPGSDPAWTDSGEYTVVVTGACGSSTASATLTVVPCTADFNVDGFVNSQDFFEFLTAFFAGCP